MITRRAKIRWTTADQGGRVSGPPTATGFGEYSAPAKFMAHADSWAYECFDLIVRKTESLSELEWLVEVQFRIDDAPHEWLESGAEFELFEGRRCVARGRVE